MLEHLGFRCVVIFVLRHEAEATEHNHPRNSGSIRFDSCYRIVDGNAIGSIHVIHKP